MSKHRFKKGDLVHIAKDLGTTMSHFTNDKDAIILSYSHNRCQKGSSYEHQYSLYIKGEGSCAWYHDDQLTLIKKNQLGLLKEWKENARLKRNKERTLKYIFEHGEKILDSASGATIEALAKCLGINDSLWGASGEGLTYYTNALSILSLAEPYLINNDKKGWLAFCIRFKNEQNNNAWSIR